ncbi:MAG: hypothetical protein ACHQIM_11065 [Sphingobacteriales bacterium]
MKTAEINNKVGNSNTANKTDNSGNGQRVNNLPVSTAFNGDNKKDEPKKEESKTTATPAKQEEQPKQPAEALKTANGQAQAEQGKSEAPKAEQPKAEEAEASKKELKERLKEQQERKLAETVKLVEALGKKIAQKNKLQNTIANIDNFTITQNDEDDMASDSRFHRCELIIHDDDGEEFVTKNPFIIAYVAHEVRGLCIEKLAEVEASIVIPLLVNNCKRPMY